MGTVQVISSTPGYLTGFIDFNADGDFLDPNETVIATHHGVKDWEGEIQIAEYTFWVPEKAKPGMTYARFRFSTSDDLVNPPTPLGAAVDGEVEDYKVTIETPLDFGDRAQLLRDAYRQRRRPSPDRARLPVGRCDRLGAERSAGYGCGS